MDRIPPHMLGLAGSDLSFYSGNAGQEGAPAQRLPAVRRLWRMATRWRWILIGGLGMGALFGLLLTVFMTRQYSSTARLEISRETARVVNIDSVERDTSFFDQEFYQTQYGLMQTKALAERVARDLHVVDDPKFFKMFGRSDVFDGDMTDASKRQNRNEVAGKILLDHFGVAPVRGSSLVDVTAVTPDPALSQRIAQTWSEDFIANNLERRFEASGYARHFLETRLAALREKLELSERQAVNYASAQGIINLPSTADQKDGGGTTGDRSLLTDDLGAINGALETATAERIQAQSRLLDASRPDASNEALGNEAIGALREKRAEAASDYAKLMIQFEPDYPQARAAASQVKTLDAAIAQEERRVRSSLEQAYRSAAAREAALAVRVEGLKGALTDLRQRNIQYNIYQRDADTNRELYNALLQRYKEIGVAGGIENNNVAIADSAKLPDRPASPRLIINLILSMLAGGVIGIAVAAVLEQIDEGIGDPSQVEQKLGLPLLGTVPRTTDGDPIEALGDPRSQLTEAYMAVQANLELSTAHGTPKSFAVISTRPREGKSTTTLALAQSLARAKRSVILIDADLRSPTVHKIFGVANATGVSNFLAGGDALEEIVIKTDRDNLSIMPAGPQPPNAAELLTGERLPLLVKKLLERFDHVIVDSPPVIGLADAPLVGSAVESVLYVVEAQSIHAGTVRIALERLRTAHINVLGAVLTKFEVKRAHGAYGYDYGYGYGR